MTHPSPALLAAVLLAACPQPRDDVLHDSSPLSCDVGYLDDGDACVPEACGTGPWGMLEVDGATVHVDIEAAEGGDGSAGAPLRSIQAALDLAGSSGGGLVAVAAGSYPETLELGSDHAGVRLAGRCRELVILDASVGDDQTPGIDISSQYAEVEVSGLSVVGSRHAGVLVRSGAVRLVELGLDGNGNSGVGVFRGTATAPSELVVEGCEIEGNTAVGILAYDSGTEVSLLDTTIRDTLPRSDGGGGYGIDVHDGAVLRVEGCDLTGNTTAGLVAYDPNTVVSLVDTAVSDNRSRGDGRGGYGVQVTDGAALSAERCELAGNTSAGLVAHDPDTAVTLFDTKVLDTKADAHGEGGYGIDVQGGASLQAQSCELSRNTTLGVVAYDPGTEVSLVGTSIRDTLPGLDGEGGFGIDAHDGAALRAQGCELSGNTTAGVIAFDPDTEVTLVDTTIRDNLPRPDEEGGYGINVYGQAALEARGCELTSNTGIGLVAAEPGTAVTLADTTIRGTLPDAHEEAGYGIQVSGSAAVQARSCELVGNAGVGVVAAEPGTEVWLVDTTIRDTLPSGDDEAGFGIQVDSGAVLEARGCELAGNTWVGVAASDAHTEVTLLDTVIRDTQPGRSGEGGYGISVIEGAALEAEGCELTGNTAIGVAAIHPGTVVSLSDSSITDTRPGYGSRSATALGLSAQQGAHVSASRLLVQGNAGPGLLSWVDGAELSCTDCSLLDNAFAGAVVANEAALEIRSSTISSTLEGADLGGGVGIHAASVWGSTTPSLLVVDSTISDNLVAGTWLRGEGSYRIVDTTITGGIGVAHGATTRCGDGVFASGVPAWDGRTGLSIEGSTLSSNQGAGLFLDDASAWLDGNSWSSNDPDLLVQGEACLSPDEGWSEVPSSEICPTWDQPTCESEFRLDITPAELDPAMPPPALPRR